MPPFAMEYPSMADLLTAGADRYAVYRSMRAAGPIRRDPAWGTWVLTGYAEIEAVLRDARFSAERVGVDVTWLPEQVQEAARPVLQAVTRQMLFLDPPDHTRLRSLATKAFTPRAVEAMRPRVQSLVDEMLDEAQAAGGMDVVAGLAYPLPAAVIAELLGVPIDDRDRFKEWSDAFAAFLDGSTMNEERRHHVFASITAFLAYFRDLVRRRRGKPRNDLLQALINAEEEGDHLSEEELLTNCMLLLAAGHETTTNLIGNGIMLLLQHPEQLRTLREQPALIGNAVTELLRYESPVQLTDRRALQDVALGDIQIEAGAYTSLLLGAGNRDPRAFLDPDRLDITRQDTRHLAFGYGIHYCLGAALARLEGQVAISSLVHRFPTLRLDREDFEWQDSMVFRALKSLPVRF